MQARTTEFSSVHAKYILQNSIYSIWF